MASFIVSHSLPFEYKQVGDELHRYGYGVASSPLVRTMAPVAKKMKAIWIGCPGIHLSEEDKTDLEERSSGDEQFKVVNIETELLNDYYRICNGTLYPLFLSTGDLNDFQKQQWYSYVEVNELFAKSTANEVKYFIEKNPSCKSLPVIWIQDYHLLLMGGYVREMMAERGTRCQMAFFLHAPFPSWGVFRVYPWFEEILDGILACDLIVFHTKRDVDNFIQCCAEGLRCRANPEKGIIFYAGRVVNIKPYTMSVPFKRLEGIAKVDRLKKSTGGQLIYGVDHLEYKSGLTHRLKAFERLLEEHPEYREKVRMELEVYPSEFGENQDLKKEIKGEMERIVKRFSTPTWFHPIRIINKESVPDLEQIEDRLCCTFNRTAVALVTPLKPGLNTVAEEFVACQVDDPGVAILSQFASASESMPEAITCNPLNIDGLAAAMHKALSMPLDERELRMSALRKRVAANDINQWVENVVKAMQEYVDKDDMAKLTVDQVDKWLADYIGVDKKLFLLLDYDGTLSPIAPHPDLAHFPEDTKQVLESLLGMPDIDVAIITGRPVADIKKIVGISQITYAGNHGLDIHHSDGTIFTHPDHIQSDSIVDGLREELESVCKAFQGAWIEAKKSAMTLHYRDVSAENHPALVERAVAIIHKHNFKAMKGHCALEARPPIQWDKGRAAMYLLKTTFGVDWSDQVKIMYIGDDTTDEDAMGALKGMAATFRVTNGKRVKTNAMYRIQDTRDVHTILLWIRQFFENKQLGSTIS